MVEPPVSSPNFSNNDNDAGQKYCCCEILPPISCSMPPKRPTPGDNMSPPPSQRSTNTNDHHHSPIAGHHPDMPVDAAIAAASPSKHRKENENPNEPTTHDRHHQPFIVSDGADQQLPAPIDLLTDQPAFAATQASVLPPNAGAQGASGGARAAYVAAQQQRITTCNLSLIPPSKVTPHRSAIAHNINRCPPKDQADRNHHRDVLTANRATCPHVHAGGRQRWRGRCGSMGGHRQPTHGHSERHWASCQHPWMHDELLQQQTIPQRPPQSHRDIPGILATSGMVVCQDAS
jgi:hypothetical protein